MRIKDWIPEERPREKMRLRGAKALSNAELLAILLGSGTGGKNVIDVAQELLVKAEGRLLRLDSMSLETLTRQKGVGKVRAVTIVAALELGRRIFEETATVDKHALTSPDLVYRLMLPGMKNLDHEECWVLYLNHANFLMGKELVGVGSMEMTVIDAQKILRRAIEKQSRNVILVHNHPSGNPYPGQADISQTDILRRVLSSVDISLLDHIVVADNQYYSFAEERTGMI